MVLLLEKMTKMAKILIVDDEPKSLYSMEMLLFPEQYEIVFANSGKMALQKVVETEPDLLLLDVMMPDMTGYEVTRQLRQDPQWRHIPIILVTALDRRDDLLEGLEAGCDEFLTKPVQGPELRARVRTALRIKQQFDELQELLQLREQMADMIVHDMKSPLTALLLYIDIFNRVHALPEKHAHLLDKVSYQVHRLNKYLGDLLMLVKMRAGSLQTNLKFISVNNLCRTALEQHQDVVSAQGSHLALALPDDEIRIRLDEKLMERLLDNLISNALRFSPENGTITIRLTDEKKEAKAFSAEAVRIQVIDEGPGIPPGDRERIFEQHVALDGEETALPNLGLGLTLCKMVAEAHHGHIFVTENQPSGAVFNVIIPDLAAEHDVQHAVLTAT
jgi:two-component system sensor histidine kinase/response regulator